jgi:hypothetical protein
VNICICERGDAGFGVPYERMRSKEDSIAFEKP